MAVHLFLNELSCGSRTRREDVDAGMTRFYQMLRAVYRRRPETLLVLPVPFQDMELAEGIPVRKWASRGRGKEEFRYIQRKRQRAPYSTVLSEDRTGDLQYFHQGRPAEGIGAAHLTDGLAASLPFTALWRTPRVMAERYMLHEEADGDLMETRDTVVVRHCAEPRHVDAHADWLVDADTAAFTRGAELWEARRDLFPSLDFLPQVEKDLRNLKPVWVRPVLDRLVELQRAAASWNPRNEKTPAYRSKVTPESDTRRHLCWFTDLDGEQRLFELHARFTPGAGRLHFRLVPETARITVACIGPKL